MIERQVREHYDIMDGGKLLYPSVHYKTLEEAKADLRNQVQGRSLDEDKVIHRIRKVVQTTEIEVVSEITHQQLLLKEIKRLFKDLRDPVGKFLTKDRYIYQVCCLDCNEHLYNIGPEAVLIVWDDDAKFQHLQRQCWLCVPCAKRIAEATR